MRDAILRHLGQRGYRPRKLKELARDLGVPSTQYRAFRQTVRELEEAGLVARVRRNQYVAAGASERAIGSLHLNPRGFGFVARSGPVPDVLVQARHLGGAADGDWVEVEVLTPAAGGRLPEGRVTAIRQRPTTRLVGVVEGRGHRAVVRPDEGRWGRRVDLVEAPPPEAGPGTRVAVCVTALGPSGCAAAGRIDQVLGPAEDPGTDRGLVVAKHGLPTAFTREALAEAEACAASIEAAVPGRRDLRSWDALTIDPAAARDFDDAVSLSFDSSGNSRLGVHIADVAHYVPPGSRLDLEARERGASVYLVDAVLPMLPERLSSHLCTLAPDEDRLTLSVLATIDPAGRVLEAEVCESVIRSRARLTYEQVQAAVDGVGDAGPAAPRAELLGHMQGLSQRLKARRRDRGALDFDLPEPRVDLDADGDPVRLGRRQRLPSHDLVEEFMLVANGVVAQVAAAAGLPVLYRIHRPPDPAKLADFAAYAASMGFHFPRRGRPRLDATPTPAQLGEILAGFAGRPDADLVSQLLLRSMMRAEYSAEALGHFGLAADWYLHFTSPIRRYPDLHVHRQVKAALKSCAGALKSCAGALKSRAGALKIGAGALGSRAGRRADGAAEDAGARDAGPGGLAWLGTWTTECERRADAAERDHVRCKQLRYMARHVGEEFDGRVTGLLRGGLFAEVGELMVEGFCPLSALRSYYELDARGHCLVGQGGDRYRIGTAVRLRVARIDLALQRLDLIVLSPGEPGGRHTSVRRRRPGRCRHRRR